MTVFIGSNTIKIDDKGRFNLPVAHRNKLGDAAIVTVGLNNQLEIWPAPSFDLLITELDAKSREDETLVDTVGWLSMYSKEVGIDSQGRIALPLELRTIVGIESQINLLGRARRLEVWAANASIPITKPTKPW
jgi:MraZ protein